MQSTKAEVHKVGGHATEDQKQIRTSSWWINLPGSVHTKFYSRDLLIKSTVVIKRQEAADFLQATMNIAPGYFHRKIEEK